VFPSNEGRGYVLRRILRRAGRYAWLLGRREPTLDSLVGVVVDEMSDTYPELSARREHIVQTTRAEEERFLATIDAGMGRFDEVAPEGGSGVIAGGEAFKLYDTFGFPLDLTELMAIERGYSVDREGFSAALEDQRERSRRGSVMPGSADGGDAGTVGTETLEAARGLSAEGKQAFVGYDELFVETPVLASTVSGSDLVLILESNPFYLESGGQISDSGAIAGESWRADVRAVVPNDRGQAVVVARMVEGEAPDRPSEVRAEVSSAIRRDTERNHTATHLLHAALRQVLGDHVHQAGSLVAPDRLRFDFSHTGAVTADELEEIERRVNEEILANRRIEIDHKAYREALDAGAMALFGEKYGDEVRVVSIPGVSMELCGGCHVRATGEIGQLRLVAETGVAAGIRRVEAVTGRRAWELARETEATLDGLAETLRVPRHDVTRKVESLRDEARSLRSSLADQLGADSEDEANRLIEAAEELAGGGRLVRASIGLAAGSDVSEFGDVLREKLASGAAIIHVAVDGDKESFLGVVTDDWIARGLKAGDLVKTASKATGSGGGGRPHLAQGGVGDAAMVEEALDQARRHAREVAGG
jgi:alanyl-tRNA synthetase